MRYHPLTAEDRQAMLGRIGVTSVDVLFRDVPPQAVVPLSVFDLPDTQGELEVDRKLCRMAPKNTAA
ncbi:MAG: glycine dehydrogenase, partial [Alphaproteobacteria bacterium]|nr:glycine dehydrogenase [Alphaproteobacteria bacterium]